MDKVELREYKGKQYTVVDKYDFGGKINGNTDIAILERNGKYFIQNYEGMDLFMGPYEHAVKTGDNGEILVKDIGKKYYYVPGIKKEKPYGVGFIKEYHPEDHFAEPYTYGKGLKAAAKMEDGSIRIKHSTGHLEPEKFKYYHDTGVVEIFEGMDGRSVASAYNLTLPLEFIVRPDDPSYPASEVPSFAIVEAYGKYRKGEVSLEELPHSAFLNDTFLMRVLEVEKQKLKENIYETSETARTQVGAAARLEDLDQMAEIDIDEQDLQQRLNGIAKVVIGKRQVAVQEVEKLAAIEKKEIKSARSVDQALDFDKIIKKSNAKPRKKPTSEITQGPGLE